MTMSPNRSPAPLFEVGTGSVLLKQIRASLTRDNNTPAGSKFSASAGSAVLRSVDRLAQR